MTVDVIMDMLGKPKLRKAILDYYETLDEPINVRKAIDEGIHKESTRGLLQMALFGAKNVSKPCAFVLMFYMCICIFLIAQHKIS